MSHWKTQQSLEAQTGCVHFINILSNLFLQCFCLLLQNLNTHTHRTQETTCCFQQVSQELCAVGAQRETKSCNSWFKAQPWVYGAVWSLVEHYRNQKSFSNTRRTKTSFVVWRLHKTRKIFFTLSVKERLSESAELGSELGLLHWLKGNLVSLDSRGACETTVIDDDYSLYFV